jgi:hypothetical protein
MLPTDAAERKAAPIATGVLDYFPDALMEVARVSQIGNGQHNPGEPLHWAKEKSQDEADALMRHLADRGPSTPTAPGTPGRWPGARLRSSSVRSRLTGSRQTECQRHSLPCCQPKT